MATQFALHWLDGYRKSQRATVDGRRFTVSEDKRGWWYAYENGKRIPGIGRQLHRGMAKLAIEELVEELVEESRNGAS